MTAASSCYHCGLPLPQNGKTFPVILLGKEQLTCCPGCQFVAQTIKDTGLADYYRYRTEPAHTGKPLAQEILDEIQLYDRSDIQAEFSSKDAQGRAEAQLIIEGITCAACVWLIEHQLNQLPAVEASVNLSTHRARISWRPEQIKLSEILSAIYRIGYRAQPYHAARQDALLQNEHRAFIRRLGVAGIGMMQVMMYAVALYAGAFEGMETSHQKFLRWVSFLISTPVVLYAAQPFFAAAYRNLKNKHLSMDVPVALAIALAYLASIWSSWSGGKDVYFDSVCMFTFFLLLGRYFEFRARQKMDASGNALNKLLPTSVTLLDQGTQRTCSLKDLQPGDKVLVKAGQVVPADGRVLEGRTCVNESQVTGEFEPIAKLPGDLVIAGAINTEQPIKMEVTRTGAHTNLASILRLLDQARASKPPVAYLADKVAQYFVAAVLLLSLSVGYFWWIKDPAEAFWVVLSILVVTCPCALSLATPTALTSATSYLQRLGFLIAHGHTLEGLAQVTHVVFDKTGTLTEGRFSLIETLPLGNLTVEQCRSLAGAMEAHSEHPIARAFAPGTLQAQEVRIVPGAGIEATIELQRYRIGTPGFVLELCNLNSEHQPPTSPETQDQWILMGSEAGALAWFQLSDQLRENAQQAVHALTELGLEVELLSGDRTAAVSAVANRLGIRTCRAEALPQTKVEHIQKLQQQGAKVLMVGDGINDIPVLAAANLSVAMTNASDFAKTTADAVLLSADLQHLSIAIRWARRCRAVIRQNLTWALCYNLLALPAASLGMIPPYAAAIGMSTSSLIVVINALRLNPAHANRLKRA